MWWILVEAVKDRDLFKNGGGVGIEYRERVGIEYQ
jgi:hypothetical protein